MGQRLIPVKYERIKFLVLALKNSVEVYAWAPKPYHKFMAFKVRMGPRPTMESWFKAVLEERIIMSVH